MMNADERKTLIEAAVAAPSADNSQPWQYQWTGDDLDLWIDPARAGELSDTRHVLSDLALGACIENACIQARALGFATEVHYLPDEVQEPLLAARLKFGPPGQEPLDTDLAGVLHQRCTYRRFPWKGPIDEALQQAIAAEAQQFPGITLTWLNKGAQRDAALKALQAAESLRFRSQRLHEELFSTIDFSAGRKGSCPEGLAPRSLGVELLVWPFFKALRRWPLMRAFNVIGGAQVMGFRSAVLPARLSPGLVVLNTEGRDRISILKTGRALERVWLRATAAGLAVQPYASPGVLGLGLVEIEPRYQHRLQQIRETLDRASPGGGGLMLLRLGLAKDPQRERSSRRPWTDFERQPHG